MVTDNAEDTEKAVEGFSKAFSAAVEAEVKKRMKGETPTKGGGKTIMTKEEIMKIQDPELRQKKMLENREVFNF
ncbi:capsid assembly scaffolding protein Gp46 family protein, partial [Eubacterium aggregans]|uniref:capsid assembly scaffolding protein Gp46 family protein n=1 Tax=Eubacterium aggregans TaxID=81409 RepID=UPI003F34CAB1